MIKKLFTKLKDSFIKMISEFSIAIGPAFGRKEDFLKWIESNNYKIEKFEFASFFETGFSYWQVRRDSSCAKAILTDDKGNRKGFYLMTATWHPVITREVSPESIKFKD